MLPKKMEHVVKLELVAEFLQQMTLYLPQAIFPKSSPQLFFQSVTIDPGHPYYYAWSNSE